MSNEVQGLLRIDDGGFAAEAAALAGEVLSVGVVRAGDLHAGVVSPFRWGDGSASE